MYQAQALSNQRESPTSRPTGKATAPIQKGYSRKFRWIKDGLDSSSINGQDGYYYTGQEEGSKFVDIFHTYEHHHCHQDEEHGAIDPHVVQHGTGCIVGIRGMKNCCLWHNICLEQRESKSELEEQQHRTLCYNWDCYNN